jgi:hypothetical protein
VRCLTDRVRELAWRRRREERAEIDPAAELGFEDRYQTEGRQGMAAGREEPGLARDGPFEHVLHQLPDARCERGQVVAARRGARRCLLGIEVAQQAPVDLPDRGARQFVEPADPRRDEVGRDGRVENVAQLGRGRCGGSGGHGGDENGGLTGGENVRLDDTVDRFEAAFELAGFDTEPPDLELVVDATAVVEETVAPLPDVTGPVHATAGRSVRVRHESLRGEGRHPEVSASECAAREVDLADDALGAGHEFRIEYPGDGSPRAEPDRDVVRRGDDAGHPSS